MPNKLTIRLFEGEGGRMVASVLDPLVTSGTMFLVQGVVLLTVSKLEFARYSLVYSYVVMGQAVLSALFGGPLITLLGSIGDKNIKKVSEEAALRMQLFVGIGLGIIAFLAAMIIGLPAGLAGLGALIMVGLSFRDALRSVLVAQLKFGATVVVALWFAGITSASLFVIWLIAGRLTAEGGLTALAIGVFATLIVPILRALTSRGRMSQEISRQMLSMATWSIPGALSSWLQNSFYLTVLALSMSLEAVAEVSAARMVTMPILITSTGLLRFAQVQASRNLASEGAAKAIGNARRQALTCLAIGAAIASICWMLAWIVDPVWLPRSYPHLISLAAVWLAFAATTVARGFYTSMFQAMGRYRELFLFGVLVLPFILGGVAVGPRLLGLLGAVLPMIVGELLLLAILAARARQ